MCQGGSYGATPAGTPTWTDWLPLQIGDYTARGFQFRAELSAIATNITPSIIGLVVEIDMPDRTIGDDDIIIPIGGTRIVFDPPFREVTAVGTTANAAKVIKTNQDPSGVDIELRDDADNPVAGTVDWIAKGFGEDRPDATV